MEQQECAGAGRGEGEPGEGARGRAEARVIGPGEAWSGGGPAWEVQGVQVSLEA